jgi:hypothetical protein
MHDGEISLAGASVERLKDEPEGPGATYPIRLDGFRYNDFSRHADTDVKARLAWLDWRPKDTPFTAQPYEHLATVLTALDHRNDARTVLMAKEEKLREEHRLQLGRSGASRVRRAGATVLDWLLKWTIGYGY